MEPVARISLANQKGQQGKMKIKQILYHVRPLVSNDGLLDNSLIANWVYRFYFSPHFNFFFHLCTFYCHQTLKIVSQGPFARDPDNHFSCSGWRHLHNTYCAFQTRTSNFFFFNFFYLIKYLFGANIYMNIFRFDIHFHIHVCFIASFAIQR